MILKMKIIDDPLKERILVESIIKKYGYTPDHNFDWLMYCADEGEPKVVVFEEKYLIWNFTNENEWIIYSDPIAPAEIRLKLLEELVNYLFGKNTEKIFFLDVRENINNF